MVPLEANSLSFGSSSRTVLNLASSARIATPIAEARRRSPDCGRLGRSNGGAGSSGGVAGAAVLAGAGHHWGFVSIATECKNLGGPLQHGLTKSFGPPITGWSELYTQSYIPGDDRLRRGRFVGVVASRGPGRPRKTPGKQ